MSSAPRIVRIGIGRNLFTDQTIDMLYIEFHFKLFDRSGADIRNFGGDLSSGQLLHQQGGTLEGIDLYVGIHAALEAERRIGVQAEALWPSCAPRPG